MKRQTDLESKQSERERKFTGMQAGRLAGITTRHKYNQNLQKNK